MASIAGYAALIVGLTRRSEFLAASRGLRFAMPGFVLLVYPRGDDSQTIGIGFTVSKKVGNAVTRNRMKRRLRALAHPALAKVGIRGSNYVLIGRRGGNDLSFNRLGRDLERALVRARRKRGL